MKTFDYEAAWSEIARPAYESLPADLRALVARVGVECADLSQLPDTSMPWPDADAEASHGYSDSLRTVFERFESSDLAIAAQAVYSYGHWFPSLPVSQGAERLAAGDTWKFSHYADQVLRGRLGLTEGKTTADQGLSVAILEGAIRLCYASRDTWTWVEVAPATSSGMTYARELQTQASAAIEACLVRAARDNAACEFFETVKNRAALPSWVRDPSPWWVRFAYVAADYMVEESELARRRIARMPPIDKDALKAKIRKEATDKIAKVTRAETVESAGKCWLIDHDLPIDNAIYYSHTQRWAFGWRTEIDSELKSRMLDVLSEFPYDYDFTTPR